MKCSKGLDWDLASSIYSLIVELITEKLPKDKSIFLLYNKRVVRTTLILF